MKRASKPRPAAPKPTEDEIRAYAYRLYVESGCIPGRDLDNWREAEDRLRSMAQAQKATARGQPQNKRD
jgi:Protein of unknown function (DUF2934)